jgi:hypothetical protein
VTCLKDDAGRISVWETTQRQNASQRWMSLYCGGLLRGMVMVELRHDVERHIARIARFGAVLAAFAAQGCGRAPVAETPPQTPAQRESTNARPASDERRNDTSSANPEGNASPKERHAEPSNQAPPTIGRETQPFPQTVYRPDDERPKHDDRRLAAMGIQTFASKRLKLYTDIEADRARSLPGLIDQAYRDLEEYFGPLPPDRARTDFQVTGYLIKDEALFREAGLVPDDLPPFQHGRHRHYEFWMRNQKDDYYRRHLLIHEVTHCFMTIMPGVDAPVWYMEGMAEYFGTHTIDAAGVARFRVMPTSPEEFAGLGRIRLIRDDYDAGRARSMNSVFELKSIEYLKNEPYAWSWALCMFLDSHPRYQRRFREMGQHLQGGAFRGEFLSRFAIDERDLVTEWTLFVTNLQHGYDTERAAIDFEPGTELTEDHVEEKIKIAADRGWQSSGVLLEAGQTYKVTASGRFTLAEQPKPWLSEPQGISFRYFQGRPLGQLLGCIRSETGEVGGESESMLKTFVLGREQTLTATTSGTLYLRLNDAWNSLADNSGSAEATIQKTPPSDEPKK